MSKSRKSKKKKARRPNLSPLSVLRPRFDGLFGNPDWVDVEPDTILADLNVTTRGIEANDYLPVLMKAFQAAPEAAQARLDDAMPTWLQETEQVETLHQLVTGFAFDSAENPVAMRWIEAAGGDVSTIDLSHDSMFYTAFLGKDNLGSQGLFHLFYYCTRHRDRVKGINLLLDFNPPWEGAAKDGFPYPQRRPQAAVRQFVTARPGSNIIDNEELDAAAAKKALIEIFSHNREEGIRLGKDIVAMRNLFEEQVMTLPDDPDTPPFTMADFDELCQLETTTESLRMYEQTVGRRVRMDDGKEVLVMGADDDDPELMW